MTKRKRKPSRANGTNRLKRIRPGRGTKLRELRQLVDQKTKIVRLLEGLLEVAESELVDLERQIRTLEDAAGH